jgi:class 3 adenylate cyclase
MRVARLLLLAAPMNAAHAIDGPDSWSSLSASLARAHFVTRTFVCSDVVGFTRMMERVGDKPMLRMMRRHDRIVREQVALHGGTELELRGDGFVLCFEDPFAALACAEGIQRSFADHTREHAFLDVRIGVHTGPVLRDGGRYFGRDVVIAFRLLDIAKGGEIVVSESVCREIRARYPDRLVEAQLETLKGLRRKIRVAKYAWREAATGGHPEM